MKQNTHIISTIRIFLLSSFVSCSLAFADTPGYQIEMPNPITPDNCLVSDDGSVPQPRGINRTTEVHISPEIQALARALDNDPTKIYEYVRNNIDYIPLLGVRNGATATLLSKRGDDADQCALLMALLKAADPDSDAVYARGYVVYPVSFMANLLNVDANTNQVLSRLWGGLIPADVDPNVNSSIQVYRYWVETTINGTNRMLDAAYKEYDSTNALDILSIADTTAHSLWLAPPTGRQSRLNQFATQTTATSGQTSPPTVPTSWLTSAVSTPTMIFLRSWVVERSGVTRSPHCQPI